MRGVLFFSLFFRLLYGVSPDPQALNQHFLLSFPKSGTNIISSYLQSIAKNPIEIIDDTDPFRPAKNRLEISLDFTKPILFRTHQISKLEGLNCNGNKLLLILRNYKECIHRHVRAYQSAEDFRDLFRYKQPIVERYAQTLSTFDHWDPSHRLLIYYEDLIANPKEEVTKMLQFFDVPIPDALTDEFLQEVRAKTLESYHRQHIKTGGSQSKGIDPLYHSKQIPYEYLHEIDFAMRRDYPFLFHSYLFKYRES